MTYDGRAFMLEIGLLDDFRDGFACRSGQQVEQPSLKLGVANKAHHHPTADACGEKRLLQTTTA